MELSSDKSVDNDIKARANLGIQKLSELRNEIAGYYISKTPECNRNPRKLTDCLRIP